MKRNKAPTVLHPLVFRVSSKGNLDSRDLPSQQKEVINRQAIEIFIEASNAGRTFQDALGAVLMSGLSWGVDLSKEPKADTEG